MKKYEKLAKTMTYIFFGLLLLSFTQDYFIFDFKTTKFYGLLTTIVTAVAAIFYYGSISSKNVRIYKIYTAFLAFCYFLTFNTIYTTYTQDSYQIVFLWTKEIIITFVIFATYFLSLVLSKNKDGFKPYGVSILTVFSLAVFVAISIFIDRPVDIRPGLYLYAATIVPLLVNFILVREEIVSEPSEKMITNPVDMSDSYIFANYLDGLPSDSELKNSLAIMINKTDDHEMIIDIYSQEPDTIRIEYSKIKKLELRHEPLQIEEPKKKGSREIERVFILGKLLKNLGAEAASEELRTKLDRYDEARPHIVDHLVLTYEKQKETRVIHIYTKSDPSLFIETLEKTSPFPIERI